MPPRNGPTTPHDTNFAFPITTAMSFNRTLWKKTAQQIARESRAFANAGDEYSTFWTPVVNIVRDPRWGRNIETSGEDPYLTSEYATHFIKGFQEAPEDPEHLLASACCKHFVGNEMEDSTEAGYHNDRFHFNAEISIQDLVDSYMVPFQACVERGSVTSLMCSYNAVNGVPTCASPWLLDTVARGASGFDGAIVSDCDSDLDVFKSHNYTQTPEESVREILRAGTDVDCGDFVTSHAMSALNKSIIEETDLDDRLRQQFRLRMRLGHFDPRGPLDSISVSEVCSDYALSVMREGVSGSAVLLKNDNERLPLDLAAVGDVAVLGPNAFGSDAIVGYYGGSKPCFGNNYTVVDALEQYIKVAKYRGVADVGTSAAPDPEAIQAAQAADTVVLVLGTDLSLAQEGQDAVGLELSVGQRALFQAVA